jgi:phospholipase C
MVVMGRRGGRIVAVVGALLVAGCTSASPAPANTRSDIHKIKHVIVVMQENRSFDSYFGTYPGADGIPMSGGSPSVCIPSATQGQGPCKVVNALVGVYVEPPIRLR